MPVSRSVIEEQLTALRESDGWWAHAEVRELPSILGTDERILGIVESRIVSRILPSRRWITVVTTQRLTCLRSRDRFGRRQLDVPLSQITGVAQRTGLLRSTVTVTAGERRYRIRVRKADLLKFAGALASVVNRQALMSPALLMALPPIDSVSVAEFETVSTRVDLLEDELERLRQQVDFLEDVLQQRALSTPPAAQPG